MITKEKTTISQYYCTTKSSTLQKQITTGVSMSNRKIDLWDETIRIWCTGQEKSGASVF
jgi:hypothetical protein